MPSENINKKPESLLLSGFFALRQKTAQSTHFGFVHTFPILTS